MSKETAPMIEVLRRAPIFSDLGDADLRLLAGAVRFRDLQKGGTLFEEGDEAKGFFLLAAGKLKVFKTAPDGREQILHFIFPGDTFAEVALFAGKTYPAAAQALEASRVVFIPREGLFRLVERDPQICLSLLGGFARWVRQFNALLAEYSKAVPARLAGYLLAEALRQQPTALSDGARVRLTVNKGELAAHLGTVGETLSRAFARLRDDELIDMEEREIVIKDLAGLRDLAAGGAA
jgi:CRP/FNR family transcriptional regulator